MNRTEKEIWMPNGTKINVAIERDEDETYVCYPISGNINDKGYGKTGGGAIIDFIASYNEIQEKIKNLDNTTPTLVTFPHELKKDIDPEDTNKSTFATFPGDKKVKNDTFPRNKVERFKEIAKEMGDLYEKKDKAYGDSFGDTYNRLGIISAITRISDKYNRLCQLATKPEIDDLGERIQDTLMDLANYSVMTIIEIDDHLFGKKK